MTESKKLLRLRMGELPLIHEIAQRFDLWDLLNEHLPQSAREAVSPADTLMMLISNFAIGRHPLYELEGWVRSLDLTQLGYAEAAQFNDDRFGQVLDRLFSSDRSSLMTRIITHMVKKFNINLQQVHNDSTTIKAFGDYTGKTKTDVELKQGHSKDHRPDLKQLLFTLTVSADGAVPIHHKVYSGNRTDDTTHIETWNVLLQIHGNANFLYVADCKLCTDEQLHYIVDENQGRVVTVIPETWKEVSRFKDELRNCPKKKHEIHRSYGDFGEVKQYFYAYDGEHRTDKRGYCIHWIFSSTKAVLDRESREAALAKAEAKLRSLRLLLNKRHLKTKDEIQRACNEILNHHRMTKFITVSIEESIEESKMQIGRGRPTQETEYKTVQKKIYTLLFTRDQKALKQEERVDGVFPLLSSDSQLSTKEVLIAYKYQPKLEKRFSQLKSVHYAAPLLCKKVSRIESMMFVFFLALLLQALLEREVRKKMGERNISSLQVYPEEREAAHPTTAKIFDMFHDISSYAIKIGDDVIEQYRDEFNAVQQTVLNLLELAPEEYWDMRHSKSYT